MQDQDTSQVLLYSKKNTQHHECSIQKNGRGTSRSSQATKDKSNCIKHIEERKHVCSHMDVQPHALYSDHILAGT